LAGKRSQTHKNLNLFIFQSHPNPTQLPSTIPAVRSYQESNMPSELKSETARINGAKSHGPTTPEGKEKSSLNAIKHGLTANHTFILKCESPEEYQAMLAEHIAIHQPVTPPEKELVDQMAIARWRIRRFVAAETDLIDSEMVRNREKVNNEFAPTDSGVHLAMAIRSLADESRALSLMSRYESRHQRVHDKAYAALRELQQLRTHSPSVSAGANPEPPTVSPDPPPAQPEPVPPADNPSVSAGTSPDPKISPNEPSAPPLSSPGIHLCTPIPPASDGSPSGNSEDHDEI
jgi:hypothetical protein